MMRIAAGIMAAVLTVAAHFGGRRHAGFATLDLELGPIGVRSERQHGGQDSCGDAHHPGAQCSPMPILM